MQIKKNTENEVVDSVGKSSKEYTKLLVGSCSLAFVLEIKASRLQSVRQRTEIRPSASWPGHWRVLGNGVQRERDWSQGGELS